MASINLPEDLDKDELRQAYQAAMTLLDAAITSWPTMTANQKQTWLAANMDAVLKVQRGMLRMLGKMLG